MKWFFSSASSGWYPEDAFAVLPSDAVEVPESARNQLLRAQEAGRIVIGGADGFPVLADVVPVPLVDLAALIAAERFRREAQGIVVNGMGIDTTRDSQSLIASTAVSALMDPAYVCNFKTVSGFTELTASGILEVATAVRSYVQACFDRELALLRSIEAGDFRDEMLAEGWPDSPPGTNPAELQ